MKFKDFQHDLGASCVGAIAALPQAVAYGLIAVSPLGPEWAVFGITASIGTSILFGILAGLFGANRFMVSGPGAVTALVLASGIGVALQRGYAPADALALAYGGVVIAGLFQVVAGLLRLGHITSFIPVPVLSGFVNASALLVLLSAVPTVLGLPGVPLHEIVVEQYASISLWALAVGGFTLAVHFAMEGRLKFLPGALTALMAGTALYHGGAWALHAPAGPLVGHIDLMALWREPLLIAPALAWPDLNVADALRDADIPLLAGLSMGLLASFYTVICSSALDLRTEEDSDTNKELWVHGAFNMVMGVFGFLPGSGSPSRSAAILGSGAKTRMANYGAAVAFALSLIVLGPLIAALPLWATAGMLIATSFQAIDQATITKLRNVAFRQIPYPRVLAGDVAVTVTVVMTALLFNLIAAVGLGIFLSVALFVLSMGQSPVRRIYKGSGVHSKTQRPDEKNSCLEKEGHRIAVIEVQGALFFGSCARLLSDARALLEQGVEYLILDFRHLTSIDSTGSAKLRSLHLMCLEAGGKLMISYLEPERRSLRTPRQEQHPLPATQCRRKPAKPRWIWLNMEANDVTQVIGTDWFFGDTDAALACCENLLLQRLGRADEATMRGIIVRSPLFANLSRDQIVDLGKRAQRHRYSPNDKVFGQGDDGGRAYFLVRGRVEVLIDIPGSSRKKLISTLTEGSLFGEMGLIDGAPRSASVTATADSICYSIDRNSYSSLQAERPELVVTLLGNLSRQFATRLRVANIMISELDQ